MLWSLDCIFYIDCDTRSSHSIKQWLLSRLLTCCILATWRNLKIARDFRQWWGLSRHPLDLESSYPSPFTNGASLFFDSENSFHFVRQEIISFQCSHLRPSLLLDPNCFLIEFSVNPAHYMFEDLHNTDYLIMIPLLKCLNRRIETSFKFMKKRITSQFVLMYSLFVTEGSSDCRSDSELQNYLYVLILGQLLHGLGGTTLYTVGVSLIDDSVPASSSPMYIGE